MTRHQRLFIIIGALSLSMAAMLSAYGHHGLAGTVSEAKLRAWEWGVQMQSYHSLGLILVALLGQQLQSSVLLRWAGWIIVAALFLFSGSIYLSVLGAPKFFNEIAPTGGSSFMIAWVLVALALWLTKPKS
jgi:uncharacterized membrane protein YgdD (TMEM256/DUF423 family)